MPNKLEKGGWRGAATAGRDLAKFGVAIFIAAGFSAVQVFVIPRLLDVTTYGQYRLFLVYVGYVGLLHLGLADGAFLRWVGRAQSVIAVEWVTVNKWLIGLHLAVITLAGIIAFALASDVARTFLIFLALSALCINASTLAAYALQAAGDFTRAGRVAVLSNGLFIGLVLLTSARTLDRVLAMFCLAFALAAIYGAWGILQLRTATPTQPESALPSPPILARSGIPVLGATLAAALAQSVDRVLVSWYTPIASFALYGFASTASVAASSATQALSRVALSHAARREEKDRAAFLNAYFDVIAGGYGAALVFLPAFEYLVASHIAAYAPALPIVRALTLGLPFWVATHVVIVGTLQSYGLVRQQLLVEMSGVAAVVLLCMIALSTHEPLWVVASASSVAALCTLVIGAFVVHRSAAPSGFVPPLRFILLSVLEALAFLVAVNTATVWWIQTLVYAAIAAIPTLIAVRRARAHGW